MAEMRIVRLHGSEPMLWDGDRPLELSWPPTDLHGARTLRVDLACLRRTGARVKAELLAGESCVGHFVFAADWEGENSMLLPLATLSAPAQPVDPSSMAVSAFAPLARPEEWPAVTGMRFTLTSPGVWPSHFVLRNVETSDAEAAWPIDDADVVIEAGWHYRFARPELWRAVHGAPVVTRPWPWLKFQTRQAAGPARIVIERDFDLDLTGATEFLARLNWDSHSVLTVEALADGSWLPIAEQERWKPAVGEMRTVGASLRGLKRLERVRISLIEGETSPRDGRGVGFGLFWLLVRYASRRDAEPVREVVVRTKPGADSPDGSPVARRVRSIDALSPAPSKPKKIGECLGECLPHGFFLRRDGLERTRESVRKGKLAGVVSALLDEANKALESDVVDRNAAGSAYGGGVGLPKGYNGAGMREYAPPAAFAWLMTGEARYGEACKRWLLRAAVSPSWIGDDSGPADRPAAGDCHFYDDSFTTSHPKGFGGYMDHAFFVGSSAWGVAVASDMIWGCLDANERRIVLDGMARNGVYILYDKLRHARDFYVGQNQGVIYGLPLLMLAAFLRERDQAYRDIQDWTLRFLRDMGSREWNTEGVCSESPGYSLWTAGMYAQAVPVMSAVSGEPISSFITPNLRELMNTLLHYTSTWREQVPGFEWPVGMYWGDSSGWASPAYLAMMASVCASSSAAWWWERRFREHREPDPSLLVYSTKWPEPREPELPPAWRTLEQPQVFFRTGHSERDAIVAVHNMRSRVDHAHADRGAVVFEYHGEPLLRDPGMVGYGENVAELYKQSFCHTLPTFSGKGQLREASVQGALVPAYLTTSGDRCPGLPGGIDWVTLDLTSFYPDAVRAIRHVVFLRPDTLLLLDDLEAKQDETIELNFTCTGPLRNVMAGWMSDAKRSRLALRTGANRGQAWTSLPWGSHWPELPTYRLHGSTVEPTKELRAMTVAAAAPMDAAEPQTERLSLPRRIGVRSSTAEGAVLAFWGEPIPREQGVTTDGSILVVRMVGGRLAGVAAYGATRIELEGRALCSSAAPGLIGAVVPAH